MRQSMRRLQTLYVNVFLLSTHQLWHGGMKQGIHVLEIERYIYINHILSLFAKKLFIFI